MKFRTKRLLHKIIVLYVINMTAKTLLKIVSKANDKTQNSIFEKYEEHFRAN